MGKCGSTLAEKDFDEYDKTELESGSQGAGKHAKTSDIIISLASAQECDPEVAAYLEKVPLLMKLSKDEQLVLGANLKPLQFKEDATIIQEGDEGDEFYIIKEGRCRVTKDGMDLCTLKKGDYFGEAALRTNAKRAASIVAQGNVTLLSLHRDKFNELFGDSRLRIKFAKRVAVSAETYDPTQDSKMEVPENAIREKSQQQTIAVFKAIKKNILFEHLQTEQQSQVVDMMWLQDVPAGKNIIVQGDLGDNFYVVEEGKFDIYLNQEKGKDPLMVASREAGTSFGELALMYNAPRAATVKASVNSKCWTLHRSTFRQILTSVTQKKMRDYEEFLKKVDAFDLLLTEERTKVAEALEEVSYPPSHNIVTEGEQGDTFFILRKGEVVVTIAGKEVKRYYPGHYFGERALLKNEARAATCTTTVNCDCLYLRKRAFDMLLGPLEDIFGERVQSYNGKGQKTRVTREKASLSTSTKMSHQMLNIKLKDLHVIGTLGKGSFGHVQLVKSKQGGKTYALKTVNKQQIVKLGQQEHILSEKKVMAQLDHPFLVRLWATFKDRNHLYFLLEPSLGGELFSVLRAKTFFDEHTSRFYAAAVVLAFEYMHSKEIIYRDLKPENLLLGADGYLKITDFGFAKIVKDRTWTLCGTPDYLAPEVVSGQGHNKGVDWWTLGILVYEMLASYPPFYDEDPMKTYAKIMHGQLAFPMHFSKASVDLIRRLLHQKPTKRMGVLKGGAKLIKEHAWFKNFDWNAFYHLKLTAPIKQPVADDFDLSNFEKYPDDEEQELQYAGDPKNPDWDKDF